jgi:uncharacterized damage-inducible protein DinB
MRTSCKANLQEIRQLIAAMREEQYKYKSKLLSGATIGQHVRHILEFYLCLINGQDKGAVNYDKRERNLELETNPAFAIFIIENICSKIDSLADKTNVFLEGVFPSAEEIVESITTSVNRELVYCLEHSIHHQALIKIALIEQRIDNLIHQNFGVAPGTIKYRETCAQ